MLDNIYTQAKIVFYEDLDNLLSLIQHCRQCPSLKQTL